MTFQRENRYIVIKRKDLIAAAESGAFDASFAEVLDIVCDNLPTRECLVIESDWPEYEPAWQMIQARMEGGTPPAAQVQGEQPEVVALRAEAANLKDLLRYFDEHGATQAWVMRYKQALEGAALSAPPAAGVPTVGARPQTCNGKRCGWCKEGAEPCHYVPRAAGVPEGWKLVPAQPNEAMLNQKSPISGKEERLPYWWYQALLKASPTPPASEQQQAVSVYAQLSEQAKRRTSLENVADVLAALNPNLQPAAPSQGESE